MSGFRDVLGRGKCRGPSNGWSTRVGCLVADGVRGSGA